MPARAGREAAAAPPARSNGARLAVLVLGSLAVVALLRVFVVQSFVVPTASMEPTVRVGDRVLVSRTAYRFGDVRRGDVIVFDGAGVFDPPPEPAASGLGQLGRGIARSLGLPVGSRDYLKRVIGLPGERVACCDASGRLTVDGRPLVEPYLDPGAAASAVRFDVVVPPGRLWVLGDNRAESADSRSHLGDPGGGTVPVDSVIGRVVGIYWPAARVGGLDAGDPAVERAEGHR